MKKVTIYHNPKCTKSSLTLQLLKDGGVTPEVVFYLETPPSIERLALITSLLNCSIRNIIRTGSDDYIYNNLSDESLCDDDLLQAIRKCPTILQRPIVVVDDERAAIGRPPEKVLEIL